MGDPPHATLAEFRAWFRKWKPEVVLSLTGHEKVWLDGLRLKVPRNIGLACLVSQPRFRHGRDRRKKTMSSAPPPSSGSRRRIVRNEYGVPVHPKLMLIEGRWVNGATIIDKRNLGSS